MELGNHSEFLDIMSRNEMLAMYFVHDGGETAKWRLKGHAINLFYQFVGTWAIMLNKPQDIGFEMEGYALPTLNIIERLIHLYSNKGDTVFTPFMGIGSEVYQAVKMNRKGLGFELKESYFSLAKKNLSQLMETKKAGVLFE